MVVGDERNLITDPNDAAIEDAGGDAGAPLGRQRLAQAAMLLVH